MSKHGCKRPDVAIVQLTAVPAPVPWGLPHNLARILMASSGSAISDDLTLWTATNTLYQVFKKGLMWLGAHEVHLRTGQPLSRHLSIEWIDVKVRNRNVGRCFCRNVCFLEKIDLNGTSLGLHLAMCLFVGQMNVVFFRSLLSIRITMTLRLLLDLDQFLEMYFSHRKEWLHVRERERAFGKKRKNNVNK